MTQAMLGVGRLKGGGLNFVLTSIVDADLRSSLSAIVPSLAIRAIGHRRLDPVELL